MLAVSNVVASDSGSQLRVMAYNDNGAFAPVVSQDAELIVVEDLFAPRLSRG